MIVLAWKGAGAMSFLGNTSEEHPKLGRVIRGEHSVRLDMEKEAAEKQAEEADELSRQRQILASEIMKMSAGRLVSQLRFLDRALLRMPAVPLESIDDYGTNGKYMWFSPAHVLLSYKEEKNNITHAVLHMILHCIYMHPFQYEKMDQLLWDLSCDLAVEKTINELSIRDLELEKDGYRKKVLADLEEDMRDAFEGNDPEDESKESTENAVARSLKRAFRPGGQPKKRTVAMTAENMYRFFMDHEEKADEYLGLAYTKNACGFHFDDHRMWTAEDISGTEGSDEGRLHDNVVTGQLGCHTADSAEEEDGDFEDDVSEVFAGQSQGDWQEVSDHAQNDLSVVSREQGFGTGNMIQNLRAVNREKYDYSEFLKRFAVTGEEVHVNPDEFDYIYYTYGLKMYGNLPLIEPLEYRENRKIREFVIAVDTSGSCKGTTVEKFLRKSYNILKSTESYFDRVNIHIIQCDEKVQKDDVITNDREFEEYMKNVEVKGFGGTDFRPVFSYVDELIRKREFTDLKGLIYFTDGYGSFPEVMPDYETAFVFVDEGYVIPDVPPWAVRLVLEEEEI